MGTIEQELNLIASKIKAYNPQTEVDLSNKSALILSGLKARNYMSLRDMLVTFYKFADSSLLNPETISIYEQISKEDEEINNFISNNFEQINGNKKD